MSEDTEKYRDAVYGPEQPTEHVTPAECSACGGKGYVVSAGPPKVVDGIYRAQTFRFDCPKCSGLGLAA